MTHLSEAASAGFDASEADSSKLIGDDAVVNIDQTDDASSSDSDREFAKQVTSTMLEQVVSAAASTTVEVKDEDEEVFEPYDVTIRFNLKPSDAAVEELIESVLRIKSKYRVDCEIMTQQDHVM